MNINDYSIEYRAINIKNFYYKMLGYREFMMLRN